MSEDSIFTVNVNTNYCVPDGKYSRNNVYIVKFIFRVYVSYGSRGEKEKMKIQLMPLYKPLISRICLILLSNCR